MIIEDYFTRHTGDTSFLFGYECNSRYQFDAFFYIVEMEIKMSNGVDGGGWVFSFKKKDISFFVECMHVFMESINQYLLHIK